MGGKIGKPFPYSDAQWLDNLFGKIDRHVFLFVFVRMDFGGEPFRTQTEDPLRTKKRLRGGDLTEHACKEGKTA